MFTQRYVVDDIGHDEHVSPHSRPIVGRGIVDNELAAASSVSRLIRLRLDGPGKQHFLRRYNTTRPVFDEVMHVQSIRGSLFGLHCTHTTA